MKSAGIVGAGLIGRLLALELLKKGWQVTLFDQDEITGKSSCSYAAAGMLAPFAEAEKGEMQIYAMGMKSLTYWENLIPSLKHKVFFRRTGNILIAHPQNFPELEHMQQRLLAKLSDASSIKMLNPKELSQCEPGLSHWNSPALHLTQDGQIDNRELLSALAATLLDQGVHWNEKTFIEQIEPGKIHTDSKTFKFDLTCDCRGLGAKNDLPDLRGIRGELIILHAPEVPISHSVRLVHPRYKLYIVPRENNRFVIGASEIESEDFSPISVQTLLEQLSATYSVHPGFAEARLLETVVNCRPAFADNLPKIDFQEGFLSLNGFYRHGYLLGPAYVMDAMKLV